MKDHHISGSVTVSRDAARAAPARAAGTATVNTSRRRFTGAGLSGSVMMTLASRPALASYCSVSGTLSGNMSRPQSTPCVGLTPGYWKTHPQEWSCGYEVGLCNPITASGGNCTDYYFVTYGELMTAYGNGDITKGARNTYANWANWVIGSTAAEALPSPSIPPTTLGVAFSGSGLIFDNPDQTMMQAFWDPPGEIEPRTLIAHLTAGLLNSCRFGEEAYGYTPSTFISFVANWGDSLEDLKNAVEALNERGT